MSDFETTRMKALKLVALAARGVDGEADVAKRKLAEFLERHGLSMEDITGEDSRKERRFEVRAGGKAPDKDLRQLAVNCLAYVLQVSVKGFILDLKRESEWVPNKSKKARKPFKLASFYVITAKLTPLELEDWKACYNHYRADFLKTRAHLRLVARQALAGFLNKHNIFPPPTGDKDSKPLSLAELAALLAAMRGAQGDKWKRGHRLEQSNFMLT